MIDLNDIMEKYQQDPNFHEKWSNPEFQEKLQENPTEALKEVGVDAKEMSPEDLEKIKAMCDVGQQLERRLSR